MVPEDSVTFWLDQLQAGDKGAAQPLWERYFARLVGLARQRLLGVRRTAVDEEDVALSAFNSFCLATEQGRFPDVRDRDDLWRLLVVLTDRKAIDQAREQGRLKRGGGRTLNEADMSPDPSADTGIPGLARVADQGPSPAFAAILAEEYQRLLDQLGDEQLRSLAVLKLEGYSNEEIAGRLGCALRTVERKLGLIRGQWQREVSE
jgi:DNA-directed RNA polymerase specialized sigma24 family protein